MIRNGLSSKLIIILIILLFPINIYSQFKLDFQIRPRFELRDGSKRLAVQGSIPTALITQRSRISLIYDSDKLKVKVTPQDVRIWGDEAISNSIGVYGDNASVDIYEAFAEIKIGRSSWISVGRQGLAYDEQRLLSTRNWHQNALSYDALVLKFKVLNSDMHIGSSWNSRKSSLSNNLYFPDRIKSLNYLWLKPRINERLNISFMHIASGYTETDSTNNINFRQTTGVYSKFDFGNFRITANLYYQYGKNRFGNNVSAKLADLFLSYSSGKMISGIGLNYLSGNKTINTNTDNLFDLLYGARHKYYGYMDYFIDITNQTKEGGITDLFYSINLALPGKFKLSNQIHFMQLSSINSLTTDSKYLGFENDLIINYKINNWSDIKCGYSFYIPTENLKHIQGITNDKFSQFCFVELTVRPEFIFGGLGKN